MAKARELKEKIPLIIIRKTCNTISKATYPLVNIHVNTTVIVSILSDFLELIHFLHFIGS